MTVIGFVTLAATGGFHGHLHTFNVKEDITILPTLAGPSSATEPHYQVLFAGIVIGHGWNRADASGEPEIALTLAHFELGPRAIDVRLVPDPDPDPFNPHAHVLVWTLEA